MKKIYRYEIQYTSEDGDTKVVLHDYRVIRETEHCYFINPVYYPHKEKRVLKTAMNTYAYDTIEKAKEHFIRRTKTRIKWFNFWTEECKKGLELIEKM